MLGVCVFWAYDKRRPAERLGRYGSLKFGQRPWNPSNFGGCRPPTQHTYRTNGTAWRLIEGAAAPLLHRIGGFRYVSERASSRRRAWFYLG